MITVFGAEGGGVGVDEFEELGAVLDVCGGLPLGREFFNVLYTVSRDPLLAISLRSRDRCSPAISLFTCK